MSGRNSGQVIITAVENGYTIKMYQKRENLVPQESNYVSRSWAEVLETLKSVGAPDFVQNNKEDD